MESVKKKKIMAVEGRCSGVMETTGMEDADGRKVPEYARISRGVRFLLEDSKKKEEGLSLLVTELFKKLEIRREQICAMSEFPRRGIFDVVWNSEEDLDLFWMKVDEFEGAPVMVGVLVIPHFPRKEKIVVIRMYSPYVPEEELCFFLERYCSQVEGLGKVYNQFGFWTMKWKFRVKFKVEANGETIYPPGRFRIGPVNGDLYFSGMGWFCRKCRNYGHTKEDCKRAWCIVCEEEGHNAAECGKTKKCNLCGEGGHLYGACPQRGKKKGKRKKSIEEPSNEGEVEETLIRKSSKRRASLEGASGTGGMVPESGREEGTRKKVLQAGKKKEKLSEEEIRKEKKEREEEKDLRQYVEIKMKMFNREVVYEKVLKSLTSEPGRFFCTYKVSEWVIEKTKRYMEEWVREEPFDPGLLDLLAAFPMMRGMRF